MQRRTASLNNTKRALFAMRRLKLAAHALPVVIAEGESSAKPQTVAIAN